MMLWQVIIKECDGKNPKGVKCSSHPCLCQGMTGETNNCRVKTTACHFRGNAKYMHINRLVSMVETIDLSNFSSDVVGKIMFCNVWEPNHAKVETP